MLGHARLPLLLACILAASPVAAGEGACAAAAEAGVDQASASWVKLYEQYLLYARAMDCDDGAVAEGWSDAVARLLAGAWEDLPALARLVKEDPDFLRFVLRHVDATAAASDLERARANAEGRCPPGQRDLCRAVGGAAAAALAEGPCTFAGPPRDEAEARSRVATLAPRVQWGKALRVGLSGGGAPDYVLLGKARSETVVGVVVASACDLRFVFRLRRGSGQDDLCTGPGVARLEPEALATSGDPDAPLAARGGRSTRTSGFRLESGDCDALHFYFDGREVRWWRR